MALKDWEKQYNESYIPSFIFERKDNSKLLVVRKFRDEKKWDIFVIRPNVDLQQKIFSKKAQTKSQALKFAKAYMRKY